MKIINSPEVHYKLTESDIKIDNTIHKAYGIEGKTIKFTDVSTDKAKVEEMVERLNREQLEESQFSYFIADELDR